MTFTICLSCSRTYKTYRTMFIFQLTAKLELSSKYQTNIKQKSYLFVKLKTQVLKILRLQCLIFSYQVKGILENINDRFPECRVKMVYKLSFFQPFHGRKVLRLTNNFSASNLKNITFLFQRNYLRSLYYYFY